MRVHSSFIALVIAIIFCGLDLAAQGQAAPAPAQAPAPPPTPSKCDFAEGTTARYKVGEQLVGISFPNDAVGSTEAVTGSIMLSADGAINPAQSKITVDLKTLRSDQSLRDGYIQKNVLQTDQFPTLEFVPKRAVGLPTPFPNAVRPTAVGVELVGDMALHGVTNEVTWKVMATVTGSAIAGRATTSFPFESFKLTKPKVGMVLSTEDTIDLEVEFRCKRIPV